MMPISRGTKITASLLTSILVCLSLLIIHPAKAAERLESFSVNYLIKPDSSITVSEIWQYNFDNSQRQTVSRVVPLKYTLNNLNYHVKVKNLLVTDEVGVNQSAKFSGLGSETELQISATTGFYSGVKTFYVTYDLENAIQSQQQLSSFNWNVNGSGWRVGIMSIKASVTLPVQTPVDNLDAKCDYGAVGQSRNCLAKVSSDADQTIANYSMGNNLYPGESMKIALKFPKDFIAEPTLLTKLIRLIEDNWPLSTPFITFLISLFWRKKKTKEVPAGFRYSPPTDLSPLETAYLLRDKLNRYDLAAELLSLAYNGYLVIEVTNNEQGNGDYWIIKRKPFGQMANDFDQSILNSLFNNREAVLLSIWQAELADNNFSLDDLVRETLVDKNYLYKNPLLRRAFSLGLSLGLIAIGLVLSFFLQLDLVNQSFLLSSGIILFLVTVGVTPKSKSQQEIESEIKAFGNYLVSGQTDPTVVGNVVSKNPGLYVTYLSYAMVLGLGREWTNQFTANALPQLSWFHDSYWPETLNSFNIFNDLDTFARVLNGDLILSRTN